jgi:hypothetical protein
MANDTAALDRLDSFPEPWKPSAGDKLAGEIISIDVRETEYGEYPIVTVLTNDGRELSFHAFHTVARNEIAKLEPEVGERIGIAYHGKSADGRYERYRVLMLDREAAKPQKPDWSRMRDDSADEPTQKASEPELPPEPSPAFVQTPTDDDVPF